MAADLAPHVMLGSVYFEEATGDDSKADILQVSFVGGAPGTTMNRVTINGDKRSDGLTDGDIFFDTAAGGIGAFNFGGLSIVSANGFTVNSVTVVDGGTQIVFDLSGFDAGEKLIFAVDADEAQYVNGGDVDANSLVEGAEFQRSTIVGKFTAVGYVDLTLTATYWDDFDDEFLTAHNETGLTLPLPNDAYAPDHDYTDRTAGAVAHAAQIPLATLAGWVYHDRDDNGVFAKGSEQGIGGVTVELLDANGNPTGITTITSTEPGKVGYYEFRNLFPGKYGVREVQPAGWLDGKDTAGDHGGLADPETSGRVDRIFGAILDFGDNAKEYNFGELLPGSIRGKVGANNGPECKFDNPDIPLEGVRIDLLDENGNVLQTTYTNAQGDYAFTGLVPGIYSVREHQPAQYYDGGERVGSLGGATHDEGQTFSFITGIHVGSDQHGIQYDFCEKVGVTLAGNVYHDRDNDGVFDRGPEEGIGGVLLKLLDGNGNDTGKRATTDSNGAYEFTNLAAGVYTVVEIHPIAWLDGKDTPGNRGGVADISPPGDRISQITLNWGGPGIEYNFGELLPGSIRGRVGASNGPDCKFDDPDFLLEGVQIDLLDANGNVLRTTYTNALGEYAFTDLAPNVTYSVREHQPQEYFDGGERVGSLGGNSHDQGDVYSFLTDIFVGSDQHGIQYDFCEKPPASIMGRVGANLGPECKFDNPDIPLEGVRIDLLNSSGAIVATTYTNAQGYYKFEGLRAGEYQIFEHQPTGYYDGGERAGSHGGELDGVDTIHSIHLNPGDDAVHYDFCEKVGVTLSGYVYHDRSNDGIYDRSGNNPETPIAGVVLKLLDANGNDTGKRATTDGNGFYIFNDLAAGTYSVMEIHPAGWLDGIDTPGDNGGVALTSPGDMISQIALNWGNPGVEYNFGELLPGSIRGRVGANNGPDCKFDNPDILLEGVRIDLLDVNGNVLATTYTNAAGEYAFTNLAPHVTYSVREHNPIGYFDGGERVGSLGGNSHDEGDVYSFLTDIFVGSDQHGIQYDFCEKTPSSIRGRVGANNGPDCKFDNPDILLAGVKIELLDAQGNVIATTFTNSLGEYEFKGLRAGTYSVREHQPVQYFDGGERVGSEGGTVVQDGSLSIITGINLGFGVNGIQYDFCEKVPAALSGYVFIDGAPIISNDPLTPQQIAALRNGQRTSDDTPLVGVVLELRHAQTGAPVTIESAIAGSYSGAATDSIRVVTDANGYYHFGGLPAGLYAVVEVHPANVIDNVDTPGTLGGYAANPDGISHNGAGTPNPSQQSMIEQFRFENGPDAIVAIPLQYGQHAQENNFSEVTLTEEPPPPPPPPPTPPPVERPPVFGFPAYPFAPPLLFVPGAPPIKPPGIFGGSSKVVGYTWHLSVMNAGWPRSIAQEDVRFQLTSASIDVVGWKNVQLEGGRWTLAVLDGMNVNVQRDEMFGTTNSIPVTGDFNGDGVTDIAVFVDGQWFIDLNGNGKWDEGDMWAQLGSQEDLPVTGDWDADGKTDIGIYGPAWPRDPWAIEREPGLPDADNFPTKPAGKMKNMPPTVEDATSGARVLKRTARGKNRADLIDHVFHYGQPVDVPVAGDWNGDGIRQIGVFHDGEWSFDTDGDGRLTDTDGKAAFGETGDLPVVGDFNGDGVDEIGVYRGGKWILDSNGNRQVDAQDKVFELGNAESKPVVGDWNDDGTDDPGVFQPGTATDRVTRRAS
jgi:protocatechuate 3,4-dioxygenase beta subunit